MFILENYILASGVYYLLQCGCTLLGIAGTQHSHTCSRKGGISSFYHICPFWWIWPSSHPISQNSRGWQGRVEVTSSNLPAQAKPPRAEKSLASPSHTLPSGTGPHWWDPFRAFCSLGWTGWAVPGLPALTHMWDAPVHPLSGPFLDSHQIFFVLGSP